MNQTAFVCREPQIVTAPGGPTYNLPPNHGVPENHPAAPKGKNKALWWSLGGTILSAVGFICLAAWFLRRKDVRKA